MRFALALVIAIAWPCIASWPVPFGLERALVDRVAAAGTAGDQTRSFALDILVRLAEARMDAASPDLEVRVGLKASQLHAPEFKEFEVRTYAMRKIATIDNPDALRYLMNLKKADIEPDTTGQIWAAAQIAVREAQFNRISDEMAKIHFLEETTKDWSAAQSWAAEELCNRGSYRSVEFVRASIRKRESSPDVERDIQFCEARMDVVSRDPDRIKALASILTVRNGFTDVRLLGWAISQLQAMKSPRANAELDRYVNEIDGLPAGSPLKETLSPRRFQIRLEPPPPSPKRK